MWRFLPKKTRYMVALIRNQWSQMDEGQKSKENINGKTIYFLLSFLLLFGRSGGIGALFSIFMFMEAFKALYSLFLLSAWFIEMTNLLIFLFHFNFITKNQWKAIKKKWKVKSFSSFIIKLTPFLLFFVFVVVFSVSFLFCVKKKTAKSSPPPPLLPNNSIKKGPTNF